MIVYLDPMFLKLSDAVFEGYSPILEYLLIRHSERRILLALPPALISKIRRCSNIGPLANAALNSISDRYLDYSSMRRITRSGIRMLADESEKQREITDSVFEARQLEVKAFLDVAPKFYLENAPNDGNFYKLLIETFLAKEKVPTELCFSESFHGGGNTLGAAMENSDAAHLVGLCICDRDTGGDAPPFPKETTGEAAFAAAVAMKAVSNETPAVPLHPFFLIMATHGWSMENYIGPNLLDAFFQSNPSASELRVNFGAAFSDFPNLSAAEEQEWFSSHFKCQQDGADILESAYRLLGQPSQDRCAELGRLQVPSSALNWIIDNARGTRHSKSISRAIRLDLEINQYERSVRELSEVYISIFAADRRAKLM